MKRITALILIMLLLCGCSAADITVNTDSHEQITVNFPTDNTVNGYRTGSSVQESDSSMPEAIPADETKPAAPSETSLSSTAEYIGNSNSHVFHKSDCGSAKNMKDSNRVIFSSRDKAVGKGYTPCKRCNP